MVIETHFHADFLSGHLELATATGAEIGFGASAKPEFAARALHDGERISLGQVTLEILETPGHTPESISIAVYEHPDDAVPYGVLTGDTLFIGDVGRPDLLSALGSTSEELANMLHHSLGAKLMTLPDATRVFPGHGAGSACGKNLSTDLSSTIGEQRVSNYALQPMALTLDAALARQREGAILLDTRDAGAFATGHLVGSVSVGLEGRYAEYVGSLVHPDEQIVLLTEPGTELEASVRLGRIGFDHVAGYVANLYEAFLRRPDLVRSASRLTVPAFGERQRTIPALQVVDVRNPGETEKASMPGAANIPLPRLRDGLRVLDPDRPTVVFCAGGYRSSIAASLCAASGSTTYRTS